MASVKLPLKVLLPDAPDARDGCVNRLQSLVKGRAGITLAHPTRTGELCVHFDPDRTSAATVESIVRAAGAQLADTIGHGSIPVHLVSGEDSNRRVEGAITSVAGVLNVSLNLAAQSMNVEFERTKVTIDQLIAVVKDLGIAAAPAVSNASPEVKTPPSWLRRHKELVWSLCAGVALGLGWALDRFTDAGGLVPIAFYVVSYLFGAWDLASHSLSAWRRKGFAFDIDLLMLIAALGAAVLGEWVEGALLLTLFSFAHALEHSAMDKARGAIRALAQLAPAVAMVRMDGKDVEVPVEQVVAGLTVIVKPAERVPVDGTVSSGHSTINQAPVTGESVPVEKKPGDDVFAGTVNGEGALEVTVTRAVGDRTLDRIVKLVSEAQSQKANTQRWTEHFERVFVPIVLLSAVALMIVPPVVGLNTWSDSIYMGLTLLVAASPCALALGTPSAVLAGIAQAARNGVLIKGGMHLENLGTIDAIAFDKTGTLTNGTPQVTDAVVIEAASEDRLIQIAASVERLSQHPLAQGVVRAAEARGLTLLSATNFASTTARGVRADVDGDTVEIGNAALWGDRGTGVSIHVQAADARLKAAGRSTMIVRAGSKWLGVIGLADLPRAGVGETLRRLHDSGIKAVVMLTGDNRGVAAAIAAKIGVDDFRADLMPEGKVTALDELSAQYGRIAMVGDGVNDAPALARATVGIAMGAAGTAVALETADVALMSDDLDALPFAIGLARQTARIIKQNMYVSLSVIALLMLATVFARLPMSLAIAFHEGSTMVVLANSLRLLRFSAVQAPQ